MRALSSLLYLLLANFSVKYDEVLKNKIKLHPETPYLAVRHDDFGGVYEKRPYRWVSITPSDWQQSTPKNNKTIWKDKKAQEDMQIILAGATTIFIAFESTSTTPHELPNGLFEPCSNLAVLILCRCAFSFVSPPFLQCHTLRFLGLDLRFALPLWNHFTSSTVATSGMCSKKMRSTHPRRVWQFPRCTVPTSDHHLLARPEMPCLGDRA
jgi:hypothetical protein